MEDVKVGDLVTLHPNKDYLDKIRQLRGFSPLEKTMVTILKVESYHRHFSWYTLREVSGHIHAYRQESFIMLKSHFLDQHHPTEKELALFNLMYNEDLTIAYENYKPPYTRIKRWIMTITQINFGTKWTLSNSFMKTQMRKLIKGLMMLVRSN